MEIDEVLSFIGELAVNNNREWFTENKARYDSVKKCFDDFVVKLIDRISLFDASVAGLRPSDCTYRIYRDVRFSYDKAPYKRHIGAYINSHGKKSFYSGYYFHIEKENCMIAGGSYCLPSPLLNYVRNEVVENIDEFRSIVEAPDFISRFPVIGGEHLKTCPKGFPRDFKYMDYIRCKDYSVMQQVPDTLLSSENCIDEIIAGFKVLKPMNDFVNRAIDDYYKSI